MHILWFNFILFPIYIFLLYPVKNKEKRNILFLVFVVIQLTFFFAMRDISVGVDLLRYERAYEVIRHGSLHDAILIRDNYSNLGFFALCYVLIKIGVSFQAFLGFVGFFSAASICYVIKRFSKTPILSVFIYLSFGVYAFQFSGLKQTLAMDLVLWAFVFLMESKAIKFYVVILIAFLFHPTAIVVLPLYIICKTPNVKAVITVLSGVVLIIGVFRNSIGQIITTVFASDYIGRYESTGTIGSTSMLLILIIGYYVFFIKAASECNKDREATIYLRMLIVCLAIQFLSSFSYAFTRLNYYYIQFLPLVIAKMIHNEEFLSKIRLGSVKIKSTYLTWVVFFVICIYMYTNSIIEGSNTYNYTFIMGGR